jgi:RimJ/RimL family protein N-acetyltransferase
VIPLRDDAGWHAVAAGRDIAPELQQFYEANPGYWQLTHGRAPDPVEAESGFDIRPPDDMPYSDLPVWVIRDRATGRIVGEVSAATDLLASGVIHLGFFLIETALHGSGFASEVYASYEAWAVQRGARWLRLGVVAANARAEAFWRARGYLELCRRDGYVLGDRTHQLIVMMKPIGSNTMADYLAAVPRDRPEA